MVSEREILDLLGPNPHNADHLHELTEQLATRPGILPFVGAGMSADFGYPQWGAFLLKAAAVARPDMTATIKSRLNANPPEYEDAASDLLKFFEARKFQDLLAAHFGDHVIGERRLAGAVAELTKFPPGPIITTNFDRVLETVFRQAKKNLTAYSHSQAARGSEALQKGEPFLMYTAPIPLGP